MFVTGLVYVFVGLFIKIESSSKICFDFELLIEFRIILTLGPETSTREVVVQSLHKSNTLSLVSINSSSSASSAIFFK